MSTSNKDKSASGRGARGHQPAESGPGPSQDHEQAAQGLSFEEAMERLEGIVQRIESGEAGLEQSIEEYAQGMALIRRCKDVLAQAEQRVQQLSRGADADAGPRGRSDPAR